MTASKGYATIDCTDDGDNGFPRLGQANPRYWFDFAAGDA
jgi:hypothetical protein